MLVKNFVTTVLRFELLNTIFLHCFSLFDKQYFACKLCKYIIIICRLTLVYDIPYMTLRMEPKQLSKTYLATNKL